MKRLVFALLLIALPLAAQEAQRKKDDQKSNAPSASPRIQKLFLLKYADPTHVANLLGVFNASVRPDSDMHALAVETTSEATMTAIQEAIQRLDVALGRIEEHRNDRLPVDRERDRRHGAERHAERAGWRGHAAQERIRVQELPIAGYPGAADAGWTVGIDQQFEPRHADRYQYAAREDAI